MSIKHKTIFGVIIIQLIVLCLAIYVSNQSFKAFTAEAISQRALDTKTVFTSLITDAVSRQDLSTITKAAETFYQNSNLSYIVINDTFLGNWLTLGDYKTFEELNINKHTSTPQSNKTYPLTEVIYDGDKILAVIYLGFDTSSFAELKSSANNKMTYYFSAAMILSFILSWMLGKNLTNRLSQLKNVTARIAFGDRNIKIVVRSNDEIDTVLSSYQKMIKSLKKYEENIQKTQEELRNINQNLERKVQERTLSLVEKNHHLETLNLELIETKDKLIEAEKIISMNTLAAGFAHEINNPIAAVKSQIQLIRDDLNQLERWEQQINAIAKENGLLTVIEQINQTINIDDIKQGIKESIEDALSGVKKITDVIESVQFCKLEAHHQHTEINIIELINQAIKIDDIIPYINTHYEPDSFIPVFGSSVDLHKVLNGLLLNAYQAATDTSFKIDIYCYQQDKNIEIVIKDTGKGMNEQQLKQAFDPFYTTLPVGKGLGLGLTQAYSIIKEHHGQIEITSERGQWTQVYLSLPIVKDC